MKVCIGMEQIESLNCLNIHLHEVLCCAQAIILTIFFCKMISSHCWKSCTKNYSIFYNRMKVCRVN